MLNSSPNLPRSARPAQANPLLQKDHQIDSRSESEATVIQEADNTADPQYKAIPEYDERVHPKLPVNATASKYVRHLYAARNNNTRDDFKKSSKPITQCSEEKRRIISVARLIDGIYGVTASTPCNHCTKQGKVCRLFHPLVYTEEWHEVNKCWPLKKYGRRACALCMVDSSVRKYCNAQYARYSG
jgi:hypothetical protein